MAIDEAALKFAFSSGVIAYQQVTHPDEELEIGEVDKLFEVFLTNYKNLQIGLNRIRPNG